MTKKQEDFQFETDEQGNAIPTTAKNQDEPRPLTQKEREAVEGQDMTVQQITDVQAQKEARDQRRTEVQRMYDRMVQLDLAKERLTAEDIDLIVRYLAIKEVGY